MKTKFTLIVKTQKNCFFNFDNTRNFKKKMDADFGCYGSNIKWGYAFSTTISPINPRIISRPQNFQQLVNSLKL